MLGASIPRGHCDLLRFGQDLSTLRRLDYILRFVTAQTQLSKEAKDKISGHAQRLVTELESNDARALGEETVRQIQALI